MSDEETGTINPITGEWIIPSFREWFESGCNGSLFSPDFVQADSSWYLHLFPYKKWIGVALHMNESGKPKTVTYTLKIRCRNDVPEFANTTYFSSYYTCDKTINFLKKEDIQNFIVLDSLTVICYITCDTTHPVAEREIMTCAVHTDVTKKRVLKKEDPKDENSSSLDMKGREFVTCAVQTDVMKCVLEKEDPKDENCSSLDMKDDTLLRERMKHLLTKDSDYDVTICVQEKEFRAHRNILRTRSPVFAMMLSHDTKEKNTGTITIEDCDPETFNEFLLYVYSGRTENLTPSNALRLYYPADKYDFPLLKERCVSLLKTSLSVESICDVVLLAAKHQEKELLEVATEFFAQNIKKIVVTVGWQKFLPQHPVEANELIIKSTEIRLPED